MSFEDAVDLILQLEGGYVDHPDDPGGRTKYGISQRAYPSLDIARLTVEEAVEIYRRDYWQRCRCDDMPWPLSCYVFDAAVNQGVARAISLVQRALQVQVDGIIGPVTVAAAKQATLDVALRYMVLRLQHYQSLGTWQHFGSGWAHRLFSVVART